MRWPAFFFWRSARHLAASIRRRRAAPADRVYSVGRHGIGGTASAKDQSVGSRADLAAYPVRASGT